MVKTWQASRVNLPFFCRSENKLVTAQREPEKREDKELRNQDTVCYSCISSRNMWWFCSAVGSSLCLGWRQSPVRALACELVQDASGQIKDPLVLGWVEG